MCAGIQGAFGDMEGSAGGLQMGWHVRATRPNQLQPKQVNHAVSHLSLLLALTPSHDRFGSVAVTIPLH